MGTETMLLGSLLPVQLHSQSKASVNICPLPKSGKELPANAGDIRDVGSSPGLGRSLGGGYGNPLQYSLPQESCGQRNLVGYHPWGCKESDTTE